MSASDDVYRVKFAHHGTSWRRQAEWRIRQFARAMVLPAVLVGIAEGITWLIYGHFSW